MKQVILILSLVMSCGFLYSQEKVPLAKPGGAKAEMVLRSNTRDQHSILKNNTHHVQQMKRRQVTVNRQNMMNRKRTQQLQHRKMTSQQRNMHIKRLRQQSIQQQQQRRRGR